MRLPAALAVLAFAVYLLTASSDLQGNGDTSTYRFGVTRAIVDHARVWIEVPIGPHELRATPGRGGHYYASYGPGQSLMMIPFYLVGKAAAGIGHLDTQQTELYATRVLDPVLAALTLFLLVLFALRLGYGRRTAAALGLIFAFASVAWPDEQSGNEQTATMLFVLVAAYAVWQGITLRAPGYRPYFIAGTALGLAFWTRYDAVLYVGLFAVAVAFELRYSRLAYVIRVLASMAAGFFPWGLFVLGWDALTFGRPLSTGRHPTTWSTDVLGNLFGLLVSPGKGILWYLPLVFLLPWCVKRFRMRSPAAAHLFALLIVGTVGFYACISYWHGDPAWGPRYLFPLTPYLVLPLGELLARWRALGLTWRAAILAVVALSIGVQVAAVSVTPWRFWYRLEAVQERTFNASEWSGHPFLWGPSHYHYYWTPRLSPILIQFDDLYQVSRLQFLGDSRYLLTAKPASLVQSNTAQVYPVNSFEFWWASTSQPLLGSHARDAAILALLIIAASAGAVAMRELSPRPVRSDQVPAVRATA